MPISIQYTTRVPIRTCCVQIAHENILSFFCYYLSYSQIFEWNYFIPIWFHLNPDCDAFEDIEQWKNKSRLRSKNIWGILWVCVGGKRQFCYRWTMALTRGWRTPSAMVCVYWESSLQQKLNKINSRRLQLNENNSSTFPIKWIQSISFVPAFSIVHLQKFQVLFAIDYSVQN